MLETNVLSVMALTRSVLGVGAHQKGSLIGLIAPLAVLAPLRSPSRFTQCIPHVSYLRTLEVLCKL